MRIIRLLLATVNLSKNLRVSALAIVLTEGLAKLGWSGPDQVLISFTATGCALTLEFLH